MMISASGCRPKCSSTCPCKTLTCSFRTVITAISDRVYRFAPFRMTKAQRASIHAADEYLGVDDFRAGISWYRPSARW